MSEEHPPISRVYTPWQVRVPSSETLQGAKSSIPELDPYFEGNLVQYSGKEDMLVRFGMEAFKSNDFAYSVQFFKAAKNCETADQSCKGGYVIYAGAILGANPTSEGRNQFTNELQTIIKKAGGRIITEGFAGYDLGGAESYLADLRLKLPLDEYPFIEDCQRQFEDLKKQENLKKQGNH